MNSRKNTIRSYRITLSKFSQRFGIREVGFISSEDILSFLTSITDGAKQATKHSRYSHLRAFFNFVKSNIDSSIDSPCDTTMLRKRFRPGKTGYWSILEKEVVDEIIFRTTNLRNRLVLELMARGGMRISEVLGLTPLDIDGRKLILRNPKSGRGEEVVFVPRKLASRLREYVREMRIQPNQRIFPIAYQTARTVVRKAGDLVGIHLRPRDLRRHSATYASRSGTPIEIVSKVILRHTSLSTTQRYLGMVSDVEAMRWIENLYG